MWRRRPQTLQLRLFSAGAGEVAVKQVTRSNFAPALESLRGLVRAADFVALDLEMTGVASAPWREVSDFDSSEVRYSKLRDAAERFAVVQLGVCPFRWDAERNALVAHPHNFFIFPRRDPAYGQSKEFLCQTSSVEFLSKYQFDFNTCIREGISYLSRAQEEAAVKKLHAIHRDRLTASFKSLENKEMVLTRASDILFVERMKINFKLWRDNIVLMLTADCRASGEFNCRAGEFQTVFYKMRPAIVLTGFSSHQLELIQLAIRKHFKDLVYVITVGEDNDWKKAVVYTDNSEDKMLLMKEIQEDLFRSSESTVKSAVGVRHVIDLLASEQKLLVGYNCLLDIAHLHSKFFGSLPQHMKEFALAVNKNFPHIVDARHMLGGSLAVQNLMKNRSKSLSSAYSHLCAANFTSSQHSDASLYVNIEVLTDTEISSCFNSGAKHEAGYDAFMTGAVFAQACKRLGIKFELLSDVEKLHLNEKLQQHVNYLCIGYDGAVVDLKTGDDKLDTALRSKHPTVIHDNVVLIWGFPSKLKSKHLKDCICKVFGQDSVISIYSVDPTAALVQFKRKELVDDFMTLKGMLEKSDDAASILHPLRVLLDGGQTTAVPYKIYKDICSSPISKMMFADQAKAVGAEEWWNLDNGNVDSLRIQQCPQSVGESAPHVSLHQHQLKILNLKKNCDVTCQDVLDSLLGPKTGDNLC